MTKALVIFRDESILFNIFHRIMGCRPGHTLCRLNKTKIIVDNSHRILCYLFIYFVLIK